MRRVFSILAFAALGGCQTLFGGGGQVLNVQSDPPGALVVIDGAGQCETPCTVKIDSPKKARVSKAGFVTQYVTLSPGGKGNVVIPLELAAASDDVDATELPDLD